MKHLWLILLLCTFGLSGCIAGVGDGKISEQEQMVIDVITDRLAEYMKDKEEPTPVEPTEPDIIAPDDGSIVDEEPLTPPEPTLTMEVIEIHGRYNGDRPTFYGSRNLNQYPASFYFTAPGCLTRTKMTTNKERLQYGGYGGWIFKQSDVAYRGMGIVGPTACKGTKVILEY